MLAKVKLIVSFESFTTKDIAFYHGTHTNAKQ